jgi:hypothetical protein
MNTCGVGAEYVDSEVTVSFVKRFFLCNETQACGEGITLTGVIQLWCLELDNILDVKFSDS